MKLKIIKIIRFSCFNPDIILQQKESGKHLSIAVAYLDERNMFITNCSEVQSEFKQLFVTHGEIYVIQ